MSMGLVTRTPKPAPEREQSAGSRLPYARHVDDATIATRDGRLIQVIKLDGFLFETADTTELNYRKTVRETMLTRASRTPASPSTTTWCGARWKRRCTGDYPDAFSRSVDEAWRGAVWPPAGCTSTTCS